ncbi:polyprenol monophosphomannose synthase [Robertkochia marina]|uniref:Polyprenol monophosphomannose synthase n=1 Tax=Robertkochia marina TaxID=1227945 RepID=A0A4S3M1V2_9FLAO|nr:polyprenol monophosphomannose synthase [Robertkochia marina]THD69082.1 polyprenol monophosphomannose synthase [Robertkochia marina]TRZ44907.1 polyprenol monophosphomannose synthase [Robertkochia marina]
MLAKGLVIIPTYNEIENVTAITSAVFELSEPFDVLIVDDNSPDGTADKVLELQEKYPDRLHLLLRKEKQGLGKAYINGFQWALQRDYPFVFEMDADFSHDPKDLVRLYKACKKPGVDVAIGSRYVTGVNVVNWPLKRVLLSYGASFYVKFVTGMRIHDPTAGFICYRRKVIESINLEAIQFVGYAFQIEMKFRAHTRGFKLVEVPIIFKDRELGQSKMSGAIIHEAVWGVLSMKWKSLFNRKRKTYEQNTYQECEHRK